MDASEKDTEISKLAHLLKVSNKYIKSLGAVIKDKDAEIEDRDAEIKVKDAETSRLFHLLKASTPDID